MIAEHVMFTALLTVPLVLILYAERKSLRTYVYLGAFTILIASIWEPVGVYMGMWYYASPPFFFGVSVLTLLMYFHWMCFSYFLGNRVARRMRK